MKKLLAYSVGFVLAACAIVWAQSVDMPPPAGTTVMLCTYQSSTQSLTAGKAAFLQCDSSGAIRVSPVGTGNVNIVAVAGSTLVNTVPVGSIATNSIIGAASITQVQSAVGTNATLIAATPGNIYSIDICNSSNVALYVKLYDTTTTPTIGVSSPIANLQVPAGSAVGVGGCRPPMVGPISFVNGIAYALSASKSLMGSGAVGTDDLVGPILYKAQ